MIKDFLKYLRGICCDSVNILLQQKQLIQCRDCGKEYKIINSIPRYVDSEQYSGSFGLEWSIHSTTQYDNHSGINLSETRFFNETGWNRNLSQQIIIEAGCGAGSFTEQALKTGATVLSFDMSNAVEVNMKKNSWYPNLLVVQADILKIPFRKEIADKCFCFGTLQHTPNPKKALYSLIPFVKKRWWRNCF